MKSATNNIYSIILLACSGLMIPVFAVAVVAWASMQFFGWQPMRPIVDLGGMCVLLLVMIVLPAVASVLLGYLLEPAEAADQA